MYRLKFAVKMMMHFKAVFSVHLEIIDIYQVYVINKQK